MIAVTIATTAVWVAGVCTLMSLHRSTGPTGSATPAAGPAAAPVAPAPALPAPTVPAPAVERVAPMALVPGPRVSPEDQPVMPNLPVAPFVPAPRSPLR